MADRFSMRFYVEARTPFLDNELVGLVARMPPEVRTRADDPKYLREAVRDLLPTEHLGAPKRGFVLPAGAVAARRAAAAGRSPALARASRGAGHLRRELRLPRARRPGGSGRS